MPYNLKEKYGFKPGVHGVKLSEHASSLAGVRLSTSNLTLPRSPNDGSLVHLVASPFLYRLKSDTGIFM